MAKAAAIVFSLLALVTWWYFAWQDYAKDTTFGTPEYTADEDVEPSIKGFALYALDPTEPVSPGHDAPQRPDEFRFALLGVLAFAVAVNYMAFSGSGAIFSMQFVVFVALFTAVLHALVATGVLCLQAFVSNAVDFTYDLAFYAAAMYGLVTGVASWIAMRNVDGMLRGKSDNANAVMKALLVMFLVGVPLATLPLHPLFKAFGYSLALPLAALCLLSLLFIGVTRENFRYD